MHLLVFVFRESIFECKLLSGDWFEKRGFEGVKSGERDSGEGFAKGLESVSG